MTPNPTKEILEKAMVTLTNKATFAKDNFLELNDAPTLIIQLEDIKKLKKEVLEQIQGSSKANNFNKQIEEAECIIIDLLVRLERRDHDGIGRRFYDLSNALNAAAGILKVVSAIILTYYI